MPRSSQSVLLLLIVTSLASAAIHAQAPVDPAQPGEATRTPSGEPWRGTLQSGGEVRVDPRTNRPVVEGPGYRSQLWDGVHRLRDGTEIRVRDGRVVPTTDMLERRGAVPTESPREEQSGADTRPAQPSPQAAQPTARPSQQDVGSRRPCQALVDQACGRDNACAEATKCSAAHQLVEMTAEQRAQQADPAALTDTDLKCREALRDAFFAPCGRRAPAVEPGGGG
jgi:hypothetical protein